MRLLSNAEKLKAEETHSEDKKENYNSLID